MENGFVRKSVSFERDFPYFEQKSSKNRLGFCSAKTTVVYGQHEGGSGYGDTVPILSISSQKGCSNRCCFPKICCSSVRCGGVFWLERRWLHSGKQT